MSADKKNIESPIRSDYEFNQLYPESIHALARKHWTPLLVAKKAAEFLAAEKNVRILDIGSGVGKFCLGAALHRPNASYVGVEQRKELINHAEATRQLLQLENVSFIHGNFTQVDFTRFNHFYFFNSFYENLNGTEKIDERMEYSTALFDYYNRFLLKQLEKKPAGTRLATFHSVENEIPKEYLVVGSAIGNLLKFWIKV